MGLDVPKHLYGCTDLDTMFHLSVYQEMGARVVEPFQAILIQPRQKTAHCSLVPTTLHRRRDAPIFCVRQLNRLSSLSQDRTPRSRAWGAYSLTMLPSVSYSGTVKEKPFLC